MTSHKTVVRKRTLSGDRSLQERRGEETRAAKAKKTVAATATDGEASSPAKKGARALSDTLGGVAWCKGPGSEPQKPNREMVERL